MRQAPSGSWRMRPWSACSAMSRASGRSTRSKRWTPGSPGNFELGHGQPTSQEILSIIHVDARRQAARGRRQAARGSNATSPRRRGRRRGDSRARQTACCPRRAVGTHRRDAGTRGEFNRGSNDRSASEGGLNPQGLLIAHRHLEEAGSAQGTRPIRLSRKIPPAQGTELARCPCANR